MAGQRLRPWAVWITATKFNLLEVLSLSSRIDRPRFGNAFITEQHLEGSQLPLLSDELAISFLKTLYRAHGPISLSLEGKDEDTNIFIRCSRPSKDSFSNYSITFLIWVTAIEAGAFFIRHGRYVQDQATCKEPMSEAKDGLASKVNGQNKPSAAHALGEESPQNPAPAEPPTSEILKDSTTNLEFSQVSLNTVKTDHDADEWFSIPEPVDRPDRDWIENDWLILDPSEL